MKKKSKIPEPETSGEAKVTEEFPEDRLPGSKTGRRRVLKAAVAGVALLPYVAPAIESILLSEAFAQAPLGPGGRRRFRGREPQKVSPIPKKEGYRRFRYR